jgi:hypothetical protein
MLKMFDGTSVGIFEEFVFPTGNAGRLGRAALEVCDTNSVTYLVEYFAQTPDAGGYITEEPFYRDGIVEVTEQEYWEMKVYAGDTDATVSLYYDSQSGLPSPEDIVVSRWATNLEPNEFSATEGWISLDAQAIEGALAPETGRIVSGPCVTLADSALAVTFANTNPEIPLPVVLQNFTASLAGQNVLVRWETASETNSSHFIVQRSVNGTDYVELGRVEAAGTTSNRNNYSFTDEQVTKKYAGIIYYRLVQVDIDGASKTYNPVNVKLPDPDFAVQGVYPNPFDNNLVVNVVGSKDQVISLRLTTVEGKVVHSQQVFMQTGENINPAINGGKLAPGIYILEVKTPDLTENIRVIKK